MHPFTQADFYADWQRAVGRKTRQASNCQLIVYPLPFGKSFLYAPYGPVINNPEPAELDQIRAEVAAIAREEKAVFARLDFWPALPAETLAKHFSLAKPYSAQGAVFQPRQEWVLGLGSDQAELFSALPKKTRYSIKTSERREVETEIIARDFSQYFEFFYELMTETAARDGFALHPKKYYEAVFTSLPGLNAYLVLAKHRGQILTINLMIIYDQVANYVFAASGNKERERLPAYAAVWAGMKEAVKRGATYYNFGGVGEHWGGVSAFKKQFPGEVWYHSPLVDIVISPFWYRLYNLRKRLQNL